MSTAAFIVWLVAAVVLVGWPPLEHAYWRMVEKRRPEEGAGEPVGCA